MSYVEIELMKHLYLNSRVSIVQLSKKFGVSYNTLSNKLKKLEKIYKLHYTLDIDIEKLGFSEARIIAIKFEKLPELKLLKKVLFKDKFVQNAYFAFGDFDLILHVVGNNKAEYGHWESIFRIGFSKYKPHVYTSTLNHQIEGFISIRPELIYLSKEISLIEKNILSLLIKNSRSRIKDIAKITKMSEMKVIYTINKLKEKNIIKKFTVSIQNPNKLINLFYCLNLTISGDHHPNLLLNVLEKIVNDEAKNEITSDYSIICDTSGFFDAIYFCNFKDGEVMNLRGPNLIKKLWISEDPIIKNCILTIIIVGEWPFNLNDYINLKKIIITEKTKPIKFKVY